VHASPADGRLPRVLVVAPAGEYASLATLARVEHEYSLAAELDPRWAVRPLALARHQGRTVLVLDDPGGEPLDRLLGKRMDVGAFLRLAVSIAQAIGGVHDAGLIHKDIKPGNVWWRPRAVRSTHRVRHCLSHAARTCGAGTAR